MSRIVFQFYVFYENLVLSNELIKVELPPWKIWKADVSSVSPSSERMGSIRFVWLAHTSERKGSIRFVWFVGNQECAISIFPWPYNHLITFFFQVVFDQISSAKFIWVLVDSNWSSERNRHKVFDWQGRPEYEFGWWIRYDKEMQQCILHVLAPNINSCRELLTWHTLQFLPVILVLQLHWPVSRLHCWSTEPTSLHAHARNVIIIIIIIIILRKLLDSWRRRNDTKDLWPLAMARSFGVMSA